jgi:hypothetical protein
MDFMNRRASGVTARMWAAAAESGIGPHDPLAPFIDAMADAAERIETVGDELKTAAATIAVAPPTFTDDNLRTLAHALRPDLHRLARAVQIKALVIAGCTALVLLVGVFAAGYFFHGERQLVAGVQVDQPFWSKLPPTPAK